MNRKTMTIVEDNSICKLDESNMQGQQVVENIQ